LGTVNSNLYSSFLIVTESCWFCSAAKSGDVFAIKMIAAIVKKTARDSSKIRFNLTLLSKTFIFASVRFD
jgi:hypothetical protein